MSGGWAEKLIDASGSKASNVSNVANKPVIALPSTSAATKSKKPHPVHDDPLQPNTFNGKEILHYLNTSYNTHLQNAKADKEGENTKVYRSLESSSQWKTKPSSSTKIAASSASTSGPNSKSRYNSKNVIRNQRDSTGKTNGNIDLLFELNRSIYQQQQHQLAHKK